MSFYVDWYICTDVSGPPGLEIQPNNFLILSVRVVEDMYFNITFYY